jgi:hypothetical protein
MKAPHHECIALKTLQSQKHKAKPSETRKAMSVCVCKCVVHTKVPQRKDGQWTILAEFFFHTCYTPKPAKAEPKSESEH